MEEENELIINGFEDIEENEFLSAIEGFTNLESLILRLSKYIDINFVDLHIVNPLTDRLERFFIYDVSFLVCIPKDSAEMSDEDKLLWKYKFGCHYLSMKDEERTEAVRNIFVRLNLQIIGFRSALADKEKYGLIDLGIGGYENFISQTKQYESWYKKAIEKLSPEFDDLKVEMKTDINNAFAGNEIRPNRFFNWLIYNELNSGLKLNFTFEDYHKKDIPVAVAKVAKVDLSHIRFTPSLAKVHIFKYCLFSRQETEKAKKLASASFAPVDTSTEGKEIKATKEIDISPDNIELIYSALSPYFREDEKKLKQLLEGEAIDGKIKFNESAKALCNAFNTFHQAGKIRATQEQIKVWLCKYFQTKRRPYNLTQNDSLKRNFEERIVRQGDIILPTIKGLITFDKL